MGVGGYKDGTVFRDVASPVNIIIWGIHHLIFDLINKNRSDWDDDIMLLVKKDDFYFH